MSMDDRVAQSKAAAEAAAEVATAIMTDVPIAQLLSAPTRYTAPHCLRLCQKCPTTPEFCVGYARVR